jgi:Holliday junction resolvasome RuvABC endonuclease subunit
MKRVLALDLGTTLGWAVSDNLVWGQTYTPPLFGRRKLKANSHQRRSQCYVNLREFLTGFTKGLDVEFLAYEKVRFHSAVDAAHMYGGYRAIMLCWSVDRGVPTVGYHPGEIKKFATGKGNAKKSEMVDAAKDLMARNGVINYEDMDDNAADAIWIHELAQERLRCG